jgi:hypothetical protein
MRRVSGVTHGLACISKRTCMYENQHGQCMCLLALIYCLLVQNLLGIAVSTRPLESDGKATKVTHYTLI